MARNGGDVILYVDVGGEYVMVAEQTGLSLSQSREMIDASHKGHDHSKNVYGRGESTVSLELLYVDGDEGQQALQSAMIEKNNIMFEIRAGETGEDQQAEALVSSFDRDDPDNDNSTFSCELMLQDFLRPVPPPETASTQAQPRRAQQPERQSEPVTA